MTLSPIHVPDKRIVCANNKLYKINITCSGSVHQSGDIISTELEELIRAIIPLVSQCSNLKLQTTNLKAHYKLTAWPLPRKLMFEQRNKHIEAYPKMINIAVQSKKNKDSPEVKGKTVVHSRKRQASTPEQSPTNKHKFREQKNLRVSQSPQCQTISQHVDNTNTEKENERVRTRTYSNKRAMIQCRETRHRSRSLHSISTDRQRLTRSIHTRHHVDDLLSPPVKRRPLHVLSHERDKTLIAMEDMEEEIKLQQLTQLASPAHQSIHLEEEQPRRSSFIHAALELIFTPVKKMFIKEIQN